jgi:hypothetical protein
MIVWGCSEKKEESTGSQGTGESTSSAPALPMVAEVPIGKVVDWAKEVDNPSADGWDTEVMAATAKSQLKKISEIFSKDLAVEEKESALSGLVSEDYKGEEFVPELSSVFEDAIHKVARLRKDKARSRVVGRAGLAAAGNNFGSSEAEERRVEFKVVRVKPLPDGYWTEQLVSLACATLPALSQDDDPFVVDEEIRNTERKPSRVDAATEAGGARGVENRGRIGDAPETSFRALANGGPGDGPGRSLHDGWGRSTQGRAGQEDAHHGAL